jgi:hypothetical protein
LRSVHEVVGVADVDAVSGLTFMLQLDDRMFGFDSGAALGDFSHSSEQTRIMVIGLAIPF